MYPHFDGINPTGKAINEAVVDCHEFYLQRMVGMHHPHMGAAAAGYHHNSAYISRHNAQFM